MKNILSAVSLLLVMIMLLGAFASCKTNGGSETTGTETEREETTSRNEGETTTSPDSSETTTQGGGADATEPTGSETTAPSGDKETTSDAGESTTEGGNDTTTEGGNETTEPEDDTVSGLINGDDAENIEYANSLANMVNSGYADVDRNKYVISNANMTLTYNTSYEASQLVASLTDKKGNEYVSDTMDVFVRMKNGKTYYASNSVTSASTNIYRLGYYYYESRIENQIFANTTEGARVLDIPLNVGTHRVKMVEREKERILFEILDANDPYVYFKQINFNASDYKYLQLTMKSHSGVGANGEAFVMAGSSTNYSDSQRTEFYVTSDGQYHTYTIPLANLADYTGKVTGIRFDINGKAGSQFEIIDLKAIGLAEGTPDTLFLNRSFHTYSNKLHHVIQVAASEDTEDIAAVGMLTKIDASKVEAVIVKDGRGIHDGIEKIAWNTVSYVGFLIKDVGVFGYMMPYDKAGGTIKVTLADGVYTIEQVKAPDNWKILSSLDGTDNANDFFMGQRIYTDTEKNFDKFVLEAENETNPLGEENFIINPIKSGGAKFVGYDSLRGCYRFDVDAASGFRGPYEDYPNRHFGVEFEIKGDSLDRQIYVMTYAPMGSLESAAVLDEQRMLLPIPVEVAKNFKGDGENTIFMKDDSQYGETYIPLIVKANSSDKFSILNLYQNWGRFPLKQISSIQYFNPYYHLSYGTTETNCLVPFGSGGLSLPDFRTMSASIWSATNPQHNSCGSHSFVKYTNADGEYISNQMTGAVIDSYGPTYADMTIEFITDDGKIKVYYSHMEQPHHDENRSFFTLKLEILGDLTIKDFKNDFAFYSVKPNDPTGTYQRVGYLDADGVSRVVASNKTSEPVEYLLGNNAPYFSFFDMDDYTASFNKNYPVDDGPGYANVAMIIGSSEFIIGGEEKEAGFVIRDVSKTLSLSLNLGETSFKAGDSLTINGILLPWGSQEMEGKYDEIQDQNVRDVREDSILNPLKATAIENCTTVRKSFGMFLPEVESTNGKSATFTLSGGASNNAVRIYGFKSLTVPKIEQLVDGNWIPYEVSSIENRDRLGYGYQYDGYNVFYDGDGTYSYSFVVDMDNGEQTFRITADGEFEGWGEEKDPTEDLPLNVYIEPDNMADLGATLGSPYGCTYTIIEENGEKFFRFNGNGVSPEGYIIPYNRSPLYPTTGQYFVFKYRVPVTNISKTTYFDIFASTTTDSYMKSGSVRTHSSVKKDGLWHVIVVDLSAIESYTPNENGEYIAEFLRLDVLNWDGSTAKLPETDYIDIAYYGFSDNLEDICALNSDINYVDLYRNATLNRIDVASGEISEVKDPINFYFDPTEMFNMSIGGCNSMISGDGEYVRFTAKGSSEGYIWVYQNANATKVTGQYFVVKYRAPKNSGIPHNFQVYASTSAKDPADSSQMNDAVFTLDGEWKIMIIDLARLGTYTSADDGSFSAKHIRFDIINGKATHTDETPAYIDIAYMGIHDDLLEVLALEKNAKYFTYINSEGKAEKLNGDGSVYEEEIIEPEGIKVEILPESFPNPSGSNMVVADDGSYATFYSKGSGEGHFTVFTNSGKSVTGQYMFVRFRIPKGVSMPTNFQIYTSTQNTSAAQNGGNDNIIVGSILPSDDWQLLIVDLSKISTFVEDNGRYYANYLRFDMINGQYNHTEDAPSYIEIAAIGIHDSIVEILAENTDITLAQYADKSGAQQKIPTDGSFKEPEPEKDRDEGDPLNVYATADEIVDLKKGGLDMELFADGSYVRYTAKGSNEGYVYAYENAAGEKATGQLLVFKYRVPEEVTSMSKNIEVFASTSNTAPTEGDSLLIGNFVSDGNWHVMVIDLSKIPSYNESNGEFYAKYVRVDVINGKYQSDSYVDVEYFGLHDSLEEILTLNADMESVWYVNAEGKASSLSTTQE